MTHRLSAADAVALHTQTAATPGHTVSLVILERGSGLSHDVLSRQVAGVIPRLPRFRSRLVDKPFGMGQPMWAEVEHDDPAQHISRASVAAPGGERQLAELVTRLTGRPQHRGGPLWEAWTIDGLAGARWAIVVRMSPVLAEGGSGVAAMWDAVLTGAPNADGGADDVGAGSAPSRIEMVADMLSEMVENQLIGAWMAADALTGALASARARQRAAAPGRAARQVRTPMTVFNKPLTQRRSIAFASVSRTDVGVVSDAFGGSAETVLLAACTLALRAWLQRHDEVPDAPLVVAVAEGQVRAPVQLDDPVLVLTNLHTATERADAGQRRMTGDTDDFTKAFAMLWPWAARAVAHIYHDVVSSGSVGRRRHGHITFTGGGAESLSCAGTTVVGMYTAQPLVQGCGVNVSVTTHADAMDVCVSACPDNVAGVEDIARGVVAAVAVLVAAARKSPRGQGRSVVTELTSRHS